MANSFLTMPTVSAAIDEAVAKAGNGDLSPTDFKRDLGKENPTVYVAGFAADFFRRNRTCALHGSIRGNVTPLRKIGDKWVLRVRARDTFGWQSFTHELPRLTQAVIFGVWGKGKDYSSNYLIKENAFGSKANGPSANVIYYVSTFR